MNHPFTFTWNLHLYLFRLLRFTKISKYSPTVKMQGHAEQIKQIFRKSSRADVRFKAISKEENNE